MVLKRTVTNRGREFDKVHRSRRNFRLVILVKVNLVTGSRPQADGLIQKFLAMLIQVQLAHAEYIRRGFWGKIAKDVRHAC